MTMWPNIELGYKIGQTKVSANHKLPRTILL